jgi:hypothetical protein
MLDQLHELKIKRIESDAVDLCMSSGLSEFDSKAQEYQLAKKETFYTPQASLATQRNFKEKTNVTARDPFRLQTVLLGSTLAKDETDTVKRLRKIGQQMWNSKRRKVENQAKEKDPQPNS